MALPPSLPSDTRPIRSFDDPRETIPGYAVKNNGTVLRWSKRKGWSALVERVMGGKYSYVRIRFRGKERLVSVSSLVLGAWAGPRPIGHEPLHFPDPDPRNNHANNLRWAPRGAARLGKGKGGDGIKDQKGENHHSAKLTADDVREIRRLYRAGLGSVEIGDKFGVKWQTVLAILKGQTWKHVLDPLGTIEIRVAPSPATARMAKLTWDDVRQIRAAFAAGESRKDIARRFACNRDNIGLIISGKTWRDPGYVPPPSALRTLTPPSRIKSDG